jgi:hypothetical protein
MNRLLARLQKEHTDYMRVDRPGVDEEALPTLEHLRLHIDALFNIHRLEIKKKETEHFEELDTLIRSKGASTNLR